MIVFLTVLWPILLGYFLVRALAPAMSMALQICLAAGLGIGTIACFYFLQLETGVPSLLFELLLLAGTVTACWRGGWRMRAVHVQSGTVRAEPWLSLGLGVVLLGGVFEFVGLLSQHPLGGWDAWAIWNLHARFLATPFWRDYFSQAIGWTHPDYPLLLPSFLARVWSSLGENELTTPSIVAFWFTFGAVGLLGGSVAFLKGRRWGLLAALFLAATPYFIQQGALLYADVPISFFILATLILLALQDRAGPGVYGFSVLAGLSAGMAASTKNEGLLLVALLVPIRTIALWCWSGRRAAWTQMGWFAAGLAPVLGLALWVRFTLATANANLGGRPAGVLLGLLLDGQRWRVMAVELAKGLFRFGGMPVGVGLVLAGYLAIAGIDWKKDRVTVLSLSATLTSLLAGYCAVCVVSPYEVQWLTYTALDRLLAQLWPATVFLVFLAARERT